jgi:hypothetical protein
MCASLPTRAAPHPGRDHRGLPRVGALQGGAAQALRRVRDEPQDPLPAADRAGEGLRVERLGVRRAQRAHLAARAVPEARRRTRSGAMTRRRSSPAATCPWASPPGWTTARPRSAGTGRSRAAATTRVDLPGRLRAHRGGQPARHAHVPPAARGLRDRRQLVRDGPQVVGQQGHPREQREGARAHHMHKFFDGFRSNSPGNEVNPSPVYRYPFGQIHVRSVSTPALGAALGALESFNEYMKTKVSQATGGKAADNLLNNIAAAEAAAIIDREIITLERNFDEMFGYLERGEAIPLERRARFRNDSARAVSAAVEVVDALFTACGGRVLFQGNDINRHWQDVHAIRAHHANGKDGPLRNFGGVLLGRKSTDYFI